MTKSDLWIPPEDSIKISAPKSTVFYADKPPCLNPDIVPLTRDIQERLGYFHREHTAFSENAVSDISNDFKKHAEALSQSLKKQGVTFNIEDITHQAETLLNGALPEIEFLISDCDKKPYQVGCGLFTLSKISQSQLIGVYSGALDAVKENQRFSNDLGLRVTHHHRLNVSERGLMSFIQSGPNKDLGNVEDLLDQLSTLMRMTGDANAGLFDVALHKRRILRQNEWQLLETASEKKKAIAGENCIPVPIVAEHKGKDVPLVAMVAKWDISENAQLLFDYGYEYFDALKVYPEYFLTGEQEGLILEHQAYLRPSYGVLRFSHLSYCPLGDWSTLFDKVHDEEVSIQFSNEILSLTGEQLYRELLRANIIHSDDFY